MWNLDFQPPQIIEARVLTRMPAALRRPVRSEWADANKPGQVVDCFLEGPAFDNAGNLYLTDIPHGRVFRVTSSLEWEPVAQTGGWPNGVAIHADGSLWVADYRRGLLRVDPATGSVDTVLGHRNSESFKGLNDLCLDVRGQLYSLGCAFVINARGEITHIVKSPTGHTITNVAYRPGNAQLVLTDSETGTVLCAEMPAPGARLFAQR